MRRGAALAAALLACAATATAASESQTLDGLAAQAEMAQLAAASQPGRAMYRQEVAEPPATTTTTAQPATTTTAAPPETTTTQPPPPPEPSALAATAEAPPPPPGPAPPAGGECGGWSDLIARYFPDEQGTACRVMMCESGGDPTVHNRSSSASGLWQFLDSTWESTTGTPGPAADYSAETQTAAAAKLRNSSGWGQWSCY